MKRNTYQQQIILDKVLNSNGRHLSADEIYEQVKPLIQAISRSTVYRILNRLSEQNIIQRIRIPAEADKFDNRLGRHYHLCCNMCRKVFDVDMSILDEIYNRIPASEYEITGHDIIFSGLCPQCKNV